MILAYKLSRMSVNAATNLWQAPYGDLEDRRPAGGVAELGPALSGRRPPDQTARALGRSHPMVSGRSSAYRHVVTMSDMPLTTDVGVHAYWVIQVSRQNVAKV